VIPIIVLTAWPSEVARHTVSAYNLNGYLCKPFKITELVQLINDVLGQR
jgi:DNA-binding response OmpR family regulator